MPVQIVPCYFSPSVDSAWSVAPGALTNVDALAPLQVGAYGSIGTVDPFSGSFITGTDILKGKMFRQVAGTVRFLVFRKQDIDEYDSFLALTNRGTAYNAATANWEAAAWGNQIIACNYLDATQSSTGAGFAGLGGGSPKARYVAASQDFVILADVDDGGSNVYSDMVWWCGLRNPATWTPAIATQAGNIRLLGSPGPIRNVVAFRGGFVAFKDNSMFMGTYVGPPPNGFIFDWTMISNRIGCIAPDSIAELDGKLYFLHSSGFYEFDGQTIRNIGMPVYSAFLNEVNCISNAYTSHFFQFTGTPEGYALIQAVSDDVDGVVWWRTSRQIGNPSFRPAFTFYGYNPRTQRWGRWTQNTGFLGASDPHSKLVFANFVDFDTFKSDKSGRFWMIWPNSSTGTTVASVRYPVVTTNTAATYTTGIVGSVEGSQTQNRHHWRTLPGTTADSGATVTAAGYSSENKLVTNGTATGAVNTEFDYADIHISSKFRTNTVTWTVGKVTILAGVGSEMVGGGRR